MRKNNKAIVMRVPQQLWEQIKEEAQVEKVPVTEKALQYLLKGMEKKPAIPK